MVFSVLQKENIRKKGEKIQYLKQHFHFFKDHIYAVRYLTQSPAHANEDRYMANINSCWFILQGGTNSLHRGQVQQHQPVSILALY